MDAAQRTGPAVESMYRFMLWLVPAVEQFPRRQKFLLGDRLQTRALDVLERLIDATYTHDRQPHLAAANLGIERLRFLCRLAKDLRHLDMRRYTHAARALDETGRLIADRTYTSYSVFAHSLFPCALRPSFVLENFGVLTLALIDRESGTYATRNMSFPAGALRQCRLKNVSLIPRCAWIDRAHR